MFKWNTFGSSSKCNMNIRNSNLNEIEKNSIYINLQHTHFIFRNSPKVLRKASYCLKWYECHRRRNFSVVSWTTSTLHSLPPHLSSNLAFLEKKINGRKSTNVRNLFFGNNFMRLTWTWKFRRFLTASAKYLRPIRNSLRLI